MKVKKELTKQERNTTSQNTKYQIPNTQRGITLVALIITVIVLLILAIVSIRLVMNGGIIDRAERGTQAYSDSEVQEQIKLAYAEWQTAQWTSDAGDAATFVQGRLRTALNDNGLTVTEANGVFKVTFSNGKKYEYNIATGVAEEGLPDGKVKYGNQVLGIGDQVNYDPTLNATGSTTYTSPASKSGKTGENADQSFDAATYKNAGFKWRVLDVKNGKIRLIADTDVGPGDYSENATTYQLRGQTGYINGINELNTICGIFGHGKGADSATSITVDDVNAITGYNPENPRYNQGSFSEYGNKVTYTRGSGDALSSSATNGQSWSGTQSTFQYYNGTEFVNLTGSTTITSTSYSYNPTTLDSTANAPTTGVDSEGNYNEIYKMLFGEYKAVQNSTRQFTGSGRRPSYWLASECAYANSNYADWGLRCVYSGDVDYTNLCNSGGYESSYSYGVRPVVSLRSDVNIQWNATANEWQIQ